MCHEDVAAVFRPSVALCRRCYRDVKRIESEDNRIPNAPVCGDCGLVDCYHLVEIGVAS